MSLAPVAFDRGSGVSRGFWDPLWALGLQLPGHLPHRALLFLGGRVKTWKRRWFILTDNCLYYFEYTTVSETAHPPKPCKAHCVRLCLTSLSLRTRSPGASSPWRTSASGRWRTLGNRCVLSLCSPSLPPCPRHPCDSSLFSVRTALSYTTPVTKGKSSKPARQRQMAEW